MNIAAHAIYPNPLIHICTVFLENSSSSSDLRLRRGVAQGCCTGVFARALVQYHRALCCTIGMDPYGGRWRAAGAVVILNVKMISRAQFFVFLSLVVPVQPDMGAGFHSINVARDAPFVVAALGNCTFSSATHWQQPRSWSVAQQLPLVSRRGVANPLRALPTIPPWSGPQDVRTRVLQPRSDADRGGDGNEPNWYEHGLRAGFPLRAPERPAVPRLRGRNKALPGTRGVIDGFFAPVLELRGGGGVCPTERGWGSSDPRRGGCRGS